MKPDFIEGVVSYRYEFMDGDGGGCEHVNEWVRVTKDNVQLNPGSPGFGGRLDKEDEIAACQYYGCEFDFGWFNIHVENLDVKTRHFQRAVIPHTEVTSQEIIYVKIMENNSSRP
jgi:hypothetical protein